MLGFLSRGEMLAIKDRALARLQQLVAKALHRYRAPEALLQFLKTL